MKPHEQGEQPTRELLTQQRELLEREDPWVRAMRAGELITFHQDEVTELSRIRREAIEELVSNGIKQSAIAAQINMTKARLSKLLSSGPIPARAFLGTGKITVAIGGKHESQKANPSAVISAEALASYHVFSELAKSYNLETEYELVPPPGMVRLNRTNLVVMTSPRLLPMVGQVLESDQNLAFESGAQGWYLKDRTTETVYRSPSDNGEPCDYAYIGRLPRPDGQGYFLYMAGIHAMGTKGAAHYLAENIEDLYAKVKKKRFSMLIACHYDPDTREITSTENLSPIYMA